MADRSQLINNYTETSTSIPERTRPNNKQMGLGTQEINTSKGKKTSKQNSNT
ncbi:hypothetical protein JK636_07645 [Clostridium sp. YIM B02515]|uniref:Uncharacterized protein n=1 Tax=Clostridium rhizosphaerae TaxID=2803861 RepID=A0ABS1TBE6_9CLOT|nr:hypothetical protein [Clostridium rhizosphaerae]MBL4935629.1 hypothetical protein [Clostridium rhizosphaerae]